MCFCVFLCIYLHTDMPVSKCWVIVSDFLLHLRRPLFTSWDALMWLSLPTANRQAFLVSLERMCVSLGDPETLPVLVYRGLQHTKVPSSRSFVFPVFFHGDPYWNQFRANSTTVSGGGGRGGCEGRCYCGAAASIAHGRLDVIMFQGDSLYVFQFFWGCGQKQSADD